MSLFIFQKTISMTFFTDRCVRIFSFNGESLCFYFKKINRDESFHIPEDYKHDLLYWLLHPDLFLYRRIGVFLFQGNQLGWVFHIPENYKHDLLYRLLRPNLFLYRRITVFLFQWNQLGRVFSYSRRLKAWPSLLTTASGSFPLPENQWVSIPWTSFSTHDRCSKPIFSTFVNIFFENMLFCTHHTFYISHGFLFSTTENLVIDLCPSQEHSAWIPVILNCLKTNIFLSLK